ncbi:MAG: polysaccharide deacetylase family protein [Bacteroidota bacterium]|nr:polysaccharide deacetylase family protein [Bacteroidota bacterium]
MGLGSVIRVAIIRIASLFSADEKRSKVIFYHDIHFDKKYTNMSTPIDLFRKHIRIIRENGYEIVSEITNPVGQIEVCFDDGFLGLYDNIDLIKELNLSIHLFVVSSYFENKDHINKQQLLELSNFEFIKISSHTHTHKILNQISEKEIEYELIESKTTLENLLDKKVDTICFPEGKFNKKVIEIAKKRGYANQYTSIPGFFIDEIVPNTKGRSLVQFARAKEFLAILKGGDHILASWYKFKHFKR